MVTRLMHSNDIVCFVDISMKKIKVFQLFFHERYFRKYMQVTGWWELNMNHQSSLSNPSSYIYSFSFHHIFFKHNEAFDGSPYRWVLHQQVSKVICTRSLYDYGFNKPEKHFTLGIKLVILVIARKTPWTYDVEKWWHWLSHSDL